MTWEIDLHPRRFKERLWKNAGSAKAGFAVGYYEVCEFLPASSSITSQARPVCCSSLWGARSFFDETDDVVAPGGDFGEPEMSGGVGSGCAEVGG